MRTARASCARSPRPGGPGARAAAVAIASIFPLAACALDFTIGPGDGGADPPREDAGGVEADARGRRTIDCSIASCECPANEACELSCRGADACDPRCRRGADCVIRCATGACEITCEADTDCAIRCAAGACATECAGRCSVECGAGSCQCSGTGCS